MIKVKRILSLPDIWVYEDILEVNLYQNIKFYFENYKNNTVNNFEGRIVNYNNTSYRLVDTREHRRYHKLWNLSYEPDYWKQTNHTIFNWYKENSKDIIPHVMRKLIDSILKKEPFFSSSHNWIPVRGIFNLLSPNVPLDPHTDGNIYITAGDTLSATYYIDVDGEGGEFWDYRGYYYKPKNNSLLINEGSKSIHGVRASNKFRTGVTVRFVKDIDLILTGNTEDLLYKPVL
jgi:hypothetical protein